MKTIVNTILTACITLTITTFAFAQSEPPEEIQIDGYVYYAGTTDGVEGVLVTFMLRYFTYVNGEEEEFTTTEYGSDLTSSNGHFTIFWEFPQEIDPPEAWEIDYVQASIPSSYDIESEFDTWSQSTYEITPVFYVYQIGDFDHDGIVDSEELQIAEKFKPVLIRSDNVAHPELQVDLGNFETTINNNSKLTISNNWGQFSGPHTNVPNAHKWGNNPWTFCSHGHVSFGVQRFYRHEITLPNLYVGASVGNRPLYYHVYKEGSFYYVQYWYWFNFNV